MEPSHLILVDIDGLRPDVCAAGLLAGRLPGIASLLGASEGEARWGRVPVLAPAPSITFASQACLVTGAHPRQHGIPGSEFFDRFGLHSHGVPRHYAFDVGDTLAADDAVRVFIDGLASRCLLVPTLYERMGPDADATVVGHMYARGAKRWLPPSVFDLARITKGGSLFGMDAADYDRHILEKAIRSLEQSGLPKVLMIHFLGVDHEAHAHGPQAQAGYLEGVLDGMVGELWEAVQAARPAEAQILCAVISDHGHIGVIPDDRHSLHLGFPFDRELGHLFDALGLDVHDYPGEDPNCDVVVSLNGGLAHVYLQKRGGRWAEAPDFESEVRRVAQAFWEASLNGKYAVELEGALAGVLVRNAAVEGWEAPYQALTPDGEIISLEEWFAAQPEGLYADPVHRVRNLAGQLSGDLLLISNYAGGFYFGHPNHGEHGGLHPDDSNACLFVGWPGAPAAAWEAAWASFQRAIAARCQVEDGRAPSTTDLLTGLQAVGSILIS